MKIDERPARTTRRRLDASLAISSTRQPEPYLGDTDEYLTHPGGDR